ncbi:T9SS type A sorting domain-containing protein [Rubricoccus marinus]|uniref:Secretion system C-terminal sorting domain-containing protein n=1 Tax=Rubricoccus marinus TaxID=716817 RepID=A0A259U195_9BACT|nr:T9SS type A sorting domain-containing protein [Rubricoccus marinus]OZC03627.1 hypothetical protein BSZ36_11910 [Rubricoccus marinus]
MKHFTYALAGLALAVVAAAPSADAQRRAPSDADAPGELIPAERVILEAKPSSDQDVPGAAPLRPTLARDGRTLTGSRVSDQDKAAPGPSIDPRAVYVSYDAGLDMGRDGAVPTITRFQAVNVFPDGRDAPVASSKREADAGPATVTADGRDLSARPGTPLADVPAAEAPLAKAETDEAPAASGERPVLGATMPNPVGQTARITFTLSREAVAVLTLYDVRGREVSSLYEGVAAAGTHRVTVDASGLAPGTYVYVLDVDGERMSRQLQVVR